MDEEEDVDAFVHQTMLTCIGNKRKLIPHIMSIMRQLKGKLGKPCLRTADLFTGSGVVARALTSISSHVYTNDLEPYAHLMSRCFLHTPTVGDQILITRHIGIMNRIAREGPFQPGIVCDMYAPANTESIQNGERCFYTRENALIIDTLRAYIDESVPETLKVYCLVPLLIKSSIHANTAGVFKGFYKDGEGVGCFGGKGRCALGRIMHPIQLDVPVWQWGENPASATCGLGDACDFIGTVAERLDVIYIDPPYNQHPYGSNYFMLNVIASNVRPGQVSKVSGIPTDWQKSAYNQRGRAAPEMSRLLEACMAKTRYVVISYNNEGIITNDEWRRILAGYTYDVVEIPYDTFKGCRNLSSRSNKVMERMFVVGHMGLETVEE